MRSALGSAEGLLSVDGLGSVDGGSVEGLASLDGLGSVDREDLELVGGSLGLASQLVRAADLGGERVVRAPPPRWPDLEPVGLAIGREGVARLALGVGRLRDRTANRDRGFRSVLVGLLGLVLRLDLLVLGLGWLVALRSV